jgi:hypothetical protein
LVLKVQRLHLSQPQQGYLWPAPEQTICRLGHLGELVTHTAHGQNVTGVFRVGFYLSSDISDVHVRRANLTVELSIPELFHDLLAAIDPAGMSSEPLENLEFCSGQLDTVVANPNLPTQKIDRPRIRGRNSK